MLVSLILCGAAASWSAETSGTSGASEIHKITNEIAAQLRGGVTVPEEKLNSFNEFIQRLENEEGPAAALLNLDYVLDATSVGGGMEKWALQSGLGKISDLALLRDFLARLTEGDVRHRILEIETEAQPGDYLIKLVQEGEGEGEGVVYRRDASDRKFLGYLNQDVILHAGHNNIEIVTSAGSYSIKIDSDGARATIKNITYEYDPCYEPNASEKHDYDRWAYKMRGRRFILSRNPPSLLLKKLPTISKIVCGFDVGYGRAVFYKFSIMSDPEGAKVLIDGKNYGLTPSRVLIKSGSHRFSLLLSKDGFVNAAVLIDLAATPCEAELPCVAEIRAKLAPLAVHD